jgi:ABC-type phosphate/phosphonate transport system ATPase subunit
MPRPSHPHRLHYSNNTLQCTIYNSQHTKTIHKERGQWIKKMITMLSQIFSCAKKHKTLTIVSLGVGNTTSTSSSIVQLLLQEDSEFFLTLNILCFLKTMAYNNPTDKCISI